MKKLAILLLSGVLIISTSLLSSAQSEKTQQELQTCIDFGVGYIPDKEYQKVTVSTAINNLYLKRFGAFTMVELNFYRPAVIIGPTVSINHFSYVFTGMDFFTSRGLASQTFKGSRKDFGVGFYIKQLVTLKIAYSFNAGPRAEIGLRFPLGQ